MCDVAPETSLHQSKDKGQAMRSIGAPRLPAAGLRVTMLVVSAALLGCRSRSAADAFLATRVPIAHLDSVLRAADSVRLPLADARTLFGINVEAAFAPHDTMTVAEILVWARGEQARKARLDAEAKAADAARRAAVALQLDSLVAVMLVSKSYLPKNPDVERFEDFISLTFAYRNKGKKPIRAFQGDVSFVDARGDTIYSAHLSVDRPLAAGQTRREPGRIIKYNASRSEHQRLREAPLNSLKVVWQPSEVVFGDGSRVGLAAEGEEP
jgi:hypothetical protein